MNIPAVIKPEVELRAVLYSESLYSQVGAHEEPYGLRQKVLIAVMLSYVLHN